MSVETLTLEQWLAHFEGQHGKAIDLGLERVGEVARRLGLMDGPLAPHVITVAGTNGKGSTVAMLDACARAAGLSTACYSSPHFLHYNERIALDGRQATDAELISAFERIDAAQGEDPAISLSYFEAGTLAAALLIRDQVPDLALLEVGLGGRLDAVNLFDADVAVVTTIALDHADYLGSDLNVIGQEKAGIMRAGKQAVLGSRELPPTVAQHALDIGVAQCVQLGQQFDGILLDTAQAPMTGKAGATQWQWQGQSLSGASLRLGSLDHPGLPLDNAASALQALALIGVEPDQEMVNRAFASIRLPGRMQKSGRWLLDVAHNPHAAHYVASQLAHESQPRIGLLAMLGDKNADDVISALSPVIDGWVCATIEGSRGRAGSDLAHRVEAQGGQVLAVVPTVQAALDGIESNKTLAHRDVLVCGSFVTVAAALKWLEKV